MIIFDDIDDIVDSWYKLFKGIIDDHLPLKQKRVKRTSQPKWFNANILNEIKIRDSLLKKARKTNLDNDWASYKQTKYNVSNLIIKAKQDYFKNKISGNKHNSRKLWNLIKCLSRDDDESRSGIDKLSDNNNNDTVITDKCSIAETLNSFVVDYPLNLISKQRAAQVTEITNHVNQVESAFDVPNITRKQVSELLLSIPNHKATGDDGISAKILKIAASCHITIFN